MRNLTSPRIRSSSTIPIDGMFAIRRGHWKFIDGKTSGGWSKDPPVATGGQLYHLTRDPGETDNRFEAEPKVVAELSALLGKCREGG